MQCRSGSYGRILLNESDERQRALGLRTRLNRTWCHEGSRRTLVRADTNTPKSTTSTSEVGRWGGGYILSFKR